MRLPSTLLGLVLIAAPAPALDLIELKSGRILEIEEAEVRGDDLWVRLHTPPGQEAATTVPVEKVIPEFVFYIWARQLDEADHEGQVALAEWARGHGLFRQALRIYDTVARSDEALKAQLPDLVTALKEEQATWIFNRAEEFFRLNDVKAARLAAQTILDVFADTKEVGRTEELLKMIAEREQFLGEEKLREESAQRARSQQRLLARTLAGIDWADSLAESVMMRYLQDARWRLKRAGHVYVKAVVELSDLLAFAETEELRRMVDGHLKALTHRIVRTFARLADLRYLAGDIGGALDAVYQILDVDPANEAAVKLRERILDGPAPVHVRYDGGFLTFRRRYVVPTPYYGSGLGLRVRSRAYPYPGVLYGGSAFYGGASPLYGIR